MENTYWHKQTPEKPLFPDLLWSRPEQRHSAGKLLIIGGNAHGFAAPATAFSEAESAGAGTVRVLLPDAIKQVVGGIFVTGEFAPSTPSGSFSQTALADLLDNAGWANGVLLAGDLGKNSETAILIEKFMDKYKGQLTLTKDSNDSIDLKELIQKQESRLFVLTMAQLQKLHIRLSTSQPITFGMDLAQLVKVLHELTSKSHLMLIVKQGNHILCGVEGEVSTTTLREDLETWYVKTAAHASVWWLQNPGKPFEALTTAIYGAGGGT